MSFANLNIWANEKTFTIASIFSAQGNLPAGHCVIQAVVDEAQIAGIDLKVLQITSDASVEQASNIAGQAINAGADLVIGTENSQEAVVVSSQLNENKIPFIAATSAHPDITNNKPYSLSMVSDSTFYSNLTIQYMLENIEIEKLAIVQNVSLPYSEIYTKDTIALLENYGPEVEIEVFNIIDGQTDFRKIVDQIMEYSPQALFMPVYMSTVSAILLELSRYSPELSIFFNEQFRVTQANYYKLVTKSSPGITIYAILEWNGALQGEWKTDYEYIMSNFCSEYETDSNTIMTYDAIRLAINLLEKDSTLAGLPLISAIKTTEFSGVSGKIEHNEIGNLVRPLILYIFKDQQQSMETYQS